MFCPKWTSFPLVLSETSETVLTSRFRSDDRKWKEHLDLIDSFPQKSLLMFKKACCFWFMCGIHWCDRIQPFSYFSGGCRSDVMKPVLFKRKIDVPTSTPKMRSSPNWPPQGLHKTENRFDNNEKHSTTSQHALEMLHNPPLGLKQLFWWLHKGIPL